MKCNARNRYVGAPFIGAAPIHRPGAGGAASHGTCGGDAVPRWMFWERGPINRRCARSIGAYTCLVILFICAIVLLQCIKVERVARSVRIVGGQV